MLDRLKPWGAYERHRSNIAAFQAGRDARLNAFHDLTYQRGPLNDEILALSFHDLREGLQSGTYLPVDVAMAWAFKIKEVQDQNNPILDVFPDVFTKAEDLQREYEGRPKPPLYGIPFSVKGNFYVQGHDCTIGLAKFLNMPKDETCSMVSTLIDLGALPICLTNVPQGLLSFSCSNPVANQTSNPRFNDTDHTPGGSSGGEACLVAANGIPFGTGSDLAGSLRIPAAFCGVVSLKPTEDRIAITGSHGGMPGKFRLALSFGFFTKNVDDHIELYDIYLNSRAHLRHSPASVPMPFNMRQYENKNRFKIGFYKSNEFLTPVPACQRAVDDTVLKLRQQGHEIVEFKVPDPELMAQLVLQNIMPDGGAYMKELFQNDIVDENMEAFMFLLKIPNFLRQLASPLIKFASPQLAAMCRVRLPSVDDVRYMQELTDAYRQKFIKQFNDDELDAIICPSFTIHSVESKWPSKLGACAVETALYNMLNMPAGIVPVDRVNEADLDCIKNPDKYTHLHTFYSEKSYFKNWNIILNDMRRACDNVNNIGAPLAVQVVTLPYHEELCLHVMKEVERIANLSYAQGIPPPQPLRSVPASPLRNMVPRAPQNMPPPPPQNMDPPSPSDLPPATDSTPLQGHSTLM